MRVTLTKHHGLGNDFLVLFDDQPLPRLPLGVFAERWCHRRRGIGADGLLVALTRPEADADVGMALFNADGSRAEMSGNGIRCLVQAWAQRNDRAEGEARIATDAGLKVVAFGPGPDQRTIVASVAMGTAEPIDEPDGWAETGIDPLRPCLHLSLGNPHSVVAVDDVEAVDLEPLGKQVPDVNLEIVAPLEGRHELRMRVHERGAGITEACGTGAVAAAVAASRWGLAVPDEDARNPRAHGRRGCEGALHGGRRAGAHRTGHLHRNHRDRRMSLIERAIREKIVLVGVTLPPATDDTTEASLDELARLVDTAGADEAARVVQRREAPDPAYFVGKGKAEELKEVSLTVDADTVVFDNELSPAQQYNLEKLLGRTAIDRTAVILDIFGQNAHTLEGKAQVQLAMLRYRLPRLRRGVSAGLHPPGRRHRRQARPGRDAARGRPSPHHAPHQPTREGAAQPSANPPAAAQEPPAQRPGQREHRGLHERREEQPSQPAHRRRCARGEPPLRHARPHDPPACTCPVVSPFS